MLRVRWWALEAVGMKRVNTYSFFQLGSALKSVAEIQTEPIDVNKFVAVVQASTALESFLGSDVVPVRTCRAAAEEALAALKEVLAKVGATVVTKMGTPGKEVADVTLNWGEAYAVRNSVSKFETVLAAELPTMNTYSVSQKAAYSTPDLIEHAERLLPDGVQKKLSSSTKEDMREAGRCLAFSTPTAAGFHIMRATESVILAYFAHIVKKPPSKGMRNWGVYIERLEAKGADPKVTAFLRHIKDQYRNPVSHPEEFLSIDQALTLTSAAVAAICAMAEVMPELKIP
jgi:hypothetical protein